MRNGSGRNREGFYAFTQLITPEDYDKACPGDAWQIGI